MWCLYPFQAKRKDGSLISVPCGQCLACRVNKKREWFYRLKLEQLDWRYCSFGTLTYDEKQYTGTVIKYDIQCFLKRLRKAGWKFRYFLSAEYGENTERAHYHILMFTDFKIDNHKFIQLQKIWGYGQIHGFEPANDKQIKYTIKYTLKKLTGKFGDEYYKREGKEPEFCLMSRKPAIGSNQIIKNMEHNISIMAWIPPYFLKKIKGDDYVKRLKSPDYDQMKILTTKDKYQFYKNLLAKHGRKGKD